jgi:hypothetical protein
MIDGNFDNAVDAVLDEIEERTAWALYEPKSSLDSGASNVSIPPPTSHATDAEAAAADLCFAVRNMARRVNRVGAT